MKFFLSITLTLLSIFASNLLALDPVEQPGKTFLIKVEGNVEPAMAAYISRALAKASQNDHNTTILLLDTFGGRVDAALNIVDTIINTDNIKIYAYIEKRAISAGALIALACSELYMNEGTTIGDCAPITYSNEGPKMLGEKFQSPLRAKFRSLARKNGFPPLLAEAMVTQEMEILQIQTPDSTFYLEAQDFELLDNKIKNSITSKSIIVSKSELLTMDHEEAKQLNFSKQTVGSADSLFPILGLEQNEIIHIHENWSEKLVQFITLISPFLMLIGFAGIYIEIRTPGIGLPGIVGAACLAIAFLGQYLVGLANYTELLLITIGVILLAFEVFVIPGFGIAGISGFFFIFVGMLLSLQDFTIPDPQLPWQKVLMMKNIFITLLSVILSFISSILFIRYFVPQIGRVFPGPYLEKDLKDAHIKLDDQGQLHIGDIAEVITPLRPAGKIKIESKRYDAISNGDFFLKGTKVKIIKISGNKIVVDSVS